MTIAEILQQAKTLTAQEREELVKLLVDTLNLAEQPSYGPPGGRVTTPKTGAEIAAMLDEMEPIEMVDPEITDPVEWIKAQRRKEADRLKPFWDGEV